MDMSDRQSDTISRQAAIEAVCNVCSIVGDFHKCDGYPEGSTWCEEITALRTLPSAEPVRCKDCKHLFDDNKCPLRTWWTHTEDDFCSYGKRRTDE